MAATADDQARLLVSIEATQKRFEKQMAAIAKAAGDTASGIERRHKQANDNMARSFGAGGKAAEKSLGQARAAATNLSFQLNDIAMGLASGTSPFTIMVQQGSQVAQALQGAGGGVLGGLKAVGMAAASMVNPLSLASFALIGAVGYAVQYFTTAEEGSEEVNKALKEQANLLRRVADAWGEQLPGVAELAKKLQDIADANDRAAATAIVVAEAYKPAKEEIEELETLAKEVYSRLRSQRFPEEAVKKFSGAWNELQNALENNRAKASDAQRVIDALTQFPGAPKVDTLTDKVRSLADELGRAATKATEANNALLSFDSRNDPVGRRFRAERGILELPDTAPTPERRVDQYFDDPISRAAKKAENSFDKLSGVIDQYVDRVVKAESGGDRFAKNPLSSATGLGQFIEGTWLKLFRQHFPDRAQGMSDATILALRKDAEISIEMIKIYAQENANLLRSAGVAVNEAALHLSHFLGPGGAISVLKAAPGTPVSKVLSQSAIKANPSILGGGATVDDVIAYAEKRANTTATMAANYKTAAQAARELDKEQKQAAKSAEQLGGAIGGALKGLINAFADGKLEAQELLGIVMSLLSALSRMPSGGGGGGFLSGLLGSVFAFADGGVAARGRPQPLKTFARGGISSTAAIFGETGRPEAAVPLPDGRRIPVDLRAPNVSGRQSTQKVAVTVGVAIDGNGNLMPFVRSVAQGEASRAAGEVARGVPKMVDQRNDVRQTRRVRA